MLTKVGDFLLPFLPLLVVLSLCALFLWILHWILDVKRPEFSAKHGFMRQVFTIMVIVVGLLLAILVLPVKPGTRSDLLTLLGIALTAVIALSSTTFVGNIMAGLMLRAVGNFHSGDFIEVDGHFGRISERGLFHTEIQTEDRELTTLPNLYLVANPVSVIRSSETIISAELSLGYDLVHERVEKLLLKAARITGLKDPFVQIRELGDFSVTYRVAGFSQKIKELLTIRSLLKAAVLDELHGAGCEVVSPAFMNQRALDPQKPVIPRGTTTGKPAKRAKGAPVPEKLIFDKAESAEAHEDRKRRCDELAQEIDGLEDKLRDAEGEAKARLKEKISAKRERLKAMVERMAELEN